MSMFSEFANEVVSTMKVEHDYIHELAKKVKLLEARVEQLEGKE
ncbi:hypothetical protein [Aeriscardovia aeriphila]|uniref:Uncharacterized protein n=1 Tax=Aeriscardovia aeriphila TaxID=218139 RepID=A0A261FA65_9BIFI|nr:hypothetical protein [Aeriscardovia aeriphila]NYI25810.1 hypothetical protein [Aeriscardovia aeriphila]OZG56040.1 hypothetical protein AEAE_0528 [Aeriscardovia aeriphila]